MNIQETKKSFGRADPMWSEVNFLMRGDLKLPIQGGPDTLRAVYGRRQDDGSLKAVAGDGLVISLVHAGEIMIICGIGLGILVVSSPTSVLIGLKIDILKAFKGGIASKEKFIENGFIILKEESKLGSPIGCLFYEFYNDKKEITKLINNNSDSIQCVVSNINFNTNIKFGQTQCPNINDYADNNDTIKFLLKI